MNFLQKLFSGRADTPGRYYLFTVRCRRCGELIEGRVDLENDLSVDYDDGDDTYHCRKVLMGAGNALCYQQIEAVFRFDASRKLLVREVVSGGVFVE